MRDALMACAPGTVWLVAVGPLTNAALLFATFPEVAPHLKGVSIMGGAIGQGFAPPQVSLGPPYVDDEGKSHERCGNYTPFAEFNVWADPEAARSVFKVPGLQSKMVLTPLDVSHQVYTTKEKRALLLHGGGGGGGERGSTRLRTLFNELFVYVAGAYEGAWGLADGAPLHDPIAVAALLAGHPDPEVRIGFDDNGGERWGLDVVLSGLEEGRTVATKLEQGGKGVLIPRTLDVEKFWRTLEGCMATADEETGYVKL